jgi:uncharacterized protein
MEIRTQSDVRISVEESSDSKILAFDKPVRAIELTNDESAQISTLLGNYIDANLPENIELKGSPLNLQEAEQINKIEKEAKEYMAKHCFSGHDFSHVLRVFRLCNVISKDEHADRLILFASALLHDLGRGDELRDPKIDHAEKSAEISLPILEKVNFPKDKIPAVLYAIKVHRFSKGIAPTTLEAKILQDADRIDISGALGIATTFAFSGAHNRELYNLEDPFAEKRNLNDKEFAIDHFYAKLLNLPQTMHTKAGKKLAERRAAFTQRFLKELREEITWQIEK